MASRHIVKLGGCLITEKDGFCEPNYARIASLGQQIRMAVGEGISLPIIVLGGGSFGNGIPARYGLMDLQSREAKNISRMTLGMFGLMQAVAVTWRSIDLAIYPVQASAVISYGVEGYELDSRLFRLAIGAGLIPLVTGDLLLEGPSNIYSSDLVPELLVSHFAVDRVVMLTDVAGLLIRSGSAETLIEIVRPGDCHLIDAAGASSKIDVTGGMRTKVEALMRLLKLGIESTIIDGRQDGYLLKALTCKEIVGTQFKLDAR